MRARRLLLPGILVVAAYFAVFGGEYSYFEVRRARDAIARESAELTELRRVIDSLQAWADSLDVDPATLERLARERFGMIKPGETLYRFVDEDSTLAIDSADAPPGGG
ncbi:MAG TPA: septum formation initiator family protein [Longimicrobiales bacterium]|nr:septum formation initiator family protein [Longimicrobiales bacterium]